jgi:hypothetical protein
VAKLSSKEIRELAKARLKESDEGVRWTTLVKDLAAANPETPVNTIWGATQQLFKNDPNVQKISKGIYTYVESTGKEIDSPKTEAKSEALSASGKAVKEEDFYQPFAEWLRDGLDEVTEAIPVGGNVFKGKWNTPDVIGVLRPLTGDLIKFAPQIVSAEIKIDPTQPVIAFGQAISYRLFSHKCYLVLPDTTSPDDFDRVEALATVFGLGLVKFTVNPDNPNFQLICRATLAEPDMVYVNQMAKQLNNYDPKAFDKLF